MVTDEPSVDRACLTEWLGTSYARFVTRFQAVCDSTDHATLHGEIQEWMRSLDDSTIPPRSLHAEADGNRTRLGAFAPTPVLKTGGPTRRPDASVREDNVEPLPGDRLLLACP
jgi:hypothetical protein